MDIGGAGGVQADLAGLVMQAMMGRLVTRGQAALYVVGVRGVVGADGGGWGREEGGVLGGEFGGGMWGRGGDYAGADGGNHGGDHRGVDGAVEGDGELDVAVRADVDAHVRGVGV